MNINAMKSGDTMDLLSTLRTPMKQSPQSKDKVGVSKSELDAPVKTDNSQLKTDNIQLKTNTTKFQEKEKEDAKGKTSLSDATKMVDELNDYMNDLQTSLGFSVTKEPDNQIVFQIKDRNTNEIIRQIPSEEIQKIRDKMDELTGLLLDQHA
ncbi:MAG: flagellar protein FlaG [Desulfamplus sp.]|nr:flagellar protein FlaG [Desulfamplus sp.]